MVSIAESGCRSEIDRARRERNSLPHPKNKEGAGAAHAKASIQQRIERTEESVVTTPACVPKIVVAILFSFGLRRRTRNHQ